MKIDKVDIKNRHEIIGFLIVYFILFFNAFVTHDSILALASAFCGITYTILAGKGIPACYLIGVIGSAIYSYLSFQNALWGNLILYAGYYVPMQILGFFQWNKNLKQDMNEIIKTKLSFKERILLITLATTLSFVAGLVLLYMKDQNPFIDGITTVLSIFGMYLTVRRTVDQWIVWMIVNTLSLIMWLEIALSGVKVYSTVVMWAVYVILSVYFFLIWKKEINTVSS